MSEDNKSSWGVPGVIFSSHLVLFWTTYLFLIPSLPCPSLVRGNRMMVDESTVTLDFTSLAQICKRNPVKTLSRCCFVQNCTPNAQCHFLFLFIYSVIMDHICVINNLLSINWLTGLLSGKGMRKCFFRLISHSSGNSDDAVSCSLHDYLWNILGLFQFIWVIVCRLQG